MSIQIQIKRGPKNDRLAFTPAIGELIWDQTLNSLWVGDGSTLGGLELTSSSGGSGGSDTLNGLIDTDLNLLANGQYLEFQNGKWINQAPQTHQISDLTDVDTVNTPPSTNDVLSFNGTKWIPTDIIDLGNY